MRNRQRMRCAGFAVSSELAASPPHLSVQPWGGHLTLSIINGSCDQDLRRPEYEGLLGHGEKPDNASCESAQGFQEEAGYASRSHQRLDDLRIPPGNWLEGLRPDRKGQHTIAINEQFRLCFLWRNGDAYDAEITDYH